MSYQNDNNERMAQLHFMYGSIIFVLDMHVSLTPTAKCSTETTEEECQDSFVKQPRCKPLRLDYNSSY